MNKKTGVYICSGCEIGKCIDIDTLSNIAKNEYNTECCIKHSFLCNEEGIGIIKKDIAEKKLDAVVIAACSSRVNTSEFSFENDLIIERVNLREQVVWCHPPNDENTQMLAEDTLRMGIAKTLSILNPEPFIGENLSSDILVIGGGITGITSAIEGSKAGYKIFLVEKSDKLGGWANNLYKQLPQKYPYQQLENPIISEKISEIEKLNNIDIFTSSEIKEISGQPGMFEILISQNGKDKYFKAGSIVMATGWKPYDATKLAEFGYGRFKNIITNVEMEHLAKENNIVRPSDGKQVNSVLFIQCAGSRDDKHLPYCSNFCCGTSLKQAKYIRDFNAESSVFIIYKDIRTP
ncbi:MAG: CoB--CoM heterodisulfide reductase iron-sulfur subunit A family protein, partial [Mariniphaga sp.]|nr:CoB--CoM heterodisulfide reductase iron-sulfur subunit A family protein [Mariniphaga sp.]